MTAELSTLALYGLLVMVIIAIQASFGLLQNGIPYAAGVRDEQRQPNVMAARAQRMMMNSVVGLALFAPAILLINASGAAPAQTLLAAKIVLICRVVYVPCYLFGIPYLRTLVWMVGFLATAWLYLMAL